ncbi:MAG: type III-A CRISPR-associated RAMP protein Csm5 [Anaerolineae bacterium]|nr:type III-A CRISPR-associated RAMP protein Csm5 [Anaerolineae bacterium]
MGKLHDTYHLTITTLSPLHIGTGNTLRQGYDYVTHQGQTWVFDADVLADMLYEQDPGEFERMVHGAPAGELIRDNEFNPDSPLFRYVMRGEPRSRGKGAELQELLKDPWDRPYIPGSSLKGALRTALAVVGWEQRKLAFTPQELGNNVKTAAQPLERRVLGGNPPRPGDAPNYELLRVLQVSDSAPGEREDLQLINVQVAVGEKAGSPIELEAVRRDVTFQATLTLDGFLRQEHVAQRLGWSSDDQLKWLRAIPQVANMFTVHRIDSERERWATSDAPIRGFYETLARILGQLDTRSEFLLQLGWGGGWDSKTFGRVLTQKPAVFAQVVEKYGKTLVRKGEYKPGDRYPKSRRVVVRQGQMSAPLGWIKVRMERVE